MPRHPPKTTRRGGGPTSVRARRGRRAFTLLEVLIALSILVALAALAGPSLRDWYRRVAFDESCEQLRSGIALASAETRRAGVPSVLAAERTPGGGTELTLARWRPPPAAGDRGPSEIEERDGSPRLIVAELARGFFAVRPAPAADSGEPTTPTEPSAESEPASRLLIAVLMPDGSCVSTPFELHAPGGRRAGVELSVWTSEATVRQIFETPPGKLPPEPAPSGAATGTTTAAELTGEELETP
jgi:prepilin-type N-terminal cleavage/methylation domain-containing protein